MHKLLILLLLIIPLASCATVGDLEEFTAIQQDAIEDIKETQWSYQQEVDRVLADVSKSDAEVLEALKKAEAARAESLKNIAENTGVDMKELLEAIRRRTEAVVVNPSPITGNPLIDFLINAALGAAGGAVAVNRIRDKRRMARGEPVVVQPPPQNT